MRDAQRFLFSTTDAALGEASLMPQLPITLGYGNQSVTALGLLDTGATVNVLPHHIGVQLGAVWQPQSASMRLSGNLAQLAACPLDRYCVGWTISACSSSFRMG